MRIINGELKRHRFNPPKGFPSRPTTDFAKEGLFNLLNNQVVLENLYILDLFAGTGNISFEFASRQAGKIIAVDKNYKCTRFIQTFLKKYNWENRLSVVRSDALKYIQKGFYPQPFDLIFADPPYALEIHEELVDAIMNGDILESEGMFILEHGKNVDLKNHPNFSHQRSYGKVYFSFFKHNP